MKIYTLMENTASSADFAFEHGLSFYIESGQHKILFDSGQSNKFISNAHAMHLDLSQVDIFILSHGHYDHGGGLADFLKLNTKAKIYINKSAFADYYAEDGRYIGLDKELLKNDRIILCEEPKQLAENIFLTNGNNQPLKYPINSYGLHKLINNKLLTDDFQHEQYLTIIENKKRIIFSGCSHKGILNIVSWLKPDILIGGFHFMKLNCQDTKDKDILNQAAIFLSNSNAQYYTCHCTGIEQYNYLKTLLPEKLHYLSSGTILEL